MRIRILYGALALILMLVALPVLSQTNPAPFQSRRAAVPPNAVLAQVVNVVDGDTIDVLLDGEIRRVRYIGIDTPETVHPERGVEPFGLEASAANRALVEGTHIWLEFDVEREDQYGRLLAYVYLEGGGMVNAILLQLGYAALYTWPPNVKYVELFIELQKDARCAGRGMWSNLTPADLVLDECPGAQSLHPQCPPGLIPINHADLKTLQLLPSIGEARARQILQLREERPFRTVDDLQRISGIGAKLAPEIDVYVCYAE